MANYLGGGGYPALAIQAPQIDVSPLANFLQGIPEQIAGTKFEAAGYGQAAPSRTTEA